MVPAIAIPLGLATFVFAVFLRIILETVLPATLSHIIGTTIVLTALTLMIFFFTLSMVLKSPMARSGLFAIGLSLMYVGVVNWLPQITSIPPKQEEAKAGGAMTPEQLADLGRKLVFGEAPVPGQKSIGKGTCPLCHIFGQGDDPATGRCPNLFGEADRANTRTAGAKDVKECEKITLVDARSRFNTDEAKEDFKRECRKFPDESKRAEKAAFAGAPRPEPGVGMEYIAESLICPGCFVVGKFGTPGTNDRESPMPRIHKPPISLSLTEMAGVIEFLLTKEGGPPSPQQEIEAALKKFIPPVDLAEMTGAAAAAGGGGMAAPKAAGEKVGDFFAALPEDLEPKEMITKLGCNVCHAIPGVTHEPGKAPERILGPKLVEKVNAPRRIASPEYQADVAAGKARAKTPRDYVRESIVAPDAHTVKCFKEGVMSCAEANKAGDPPFPPGIMAAEQFGKKLTAGALEKLVEFLLTIDDSGPGQVATNSDVPVKTGPVFVKTPQDRPAGLGRISAGAAGAGG